MNKNEIFFVPLLLARNYFNAMWNFILFVQYLQRYLYKLYTYICIIVRAYSYIVKRFAFFYSTYLRFVPVFLPAFFYACVSALTRLLCIFFLGASTRESRYTWLLLTWSLSSILLSCQSDRAFQESEHAIIRLLGDCGRIRTSLRCTIAAKPIHSHDLLAPLTLLNTVEMRPFKIPYFSPSVSSLHFDSRMRCSTFLRGFVFLRRIL